MDVPLVDLKAQHEPLADEIMAGWGRVLARTEFVLSDEVESFESAFARFSGVGHCIGVGNGTDALELSLRAIGVGPGDEVIVPAMTFIATALAVLRAGATPMLVDVDDAWFLMDPEQVADRVTPRTKAAIPVHIYGQLAPMEQLLEAVAGSGVGIVEDAAQAHGATRGGVGAGGFGLLAATSFYPAKNLGAYGDAGAVLTNDDRLAAAVRALHNYGSEEKYIHPTIGFNSRLDALQAVVLGVKLSHLAEWNARRQAAARNYDELLSGLEEVVRPQTLQGNEHVWHLYVVRVSRRDEVLQELRRAGIGAAIHYPVPLHLHRALRVLGHVEGDFPVAEELARTALSLPMYPEITLTQQEQVIDHLRKAVR